jgi:Ca2+-binding RTX toxin-like protein
VLWGNDGADRITLGGGNGYIYGGAGDDTLYGGSGINTLIGDAGADTLIGGASTDVLWVDGQDTINGGGGLADWAIILNQVGDSINVANAGIEVAAGGAGNDTIIATGSATGITFWGAAGDEHLWGGNGNDNFYGGAGADTFHASLTRNLDQIWDWQEGLDRIAIVGATSVAQLSITHSGSTAIVTHIASGYQLYVHQSAGQIGSADFIFG